MLLVDDYKKLPDYKDVVGFLKKNAFKIADNHIFRKGRRIAAATHNYTFIWGMGGENLDYGDQDFSLITDLK